MSDNSFEPPYVGMGCTVIVGSDRYPATVIRVFRNGKSIEVQCDEHIAIDGKWPDFRYAYERDPNGQVWTYTLRSNGRWKLRRWPSTRRGGWLGMGFRDYHYDPHY